MGQSRRCTFCGGGKTLAVEWAYLPAGRARLCTAVLDVRCKWCKGTGVRSPGSGPKEASLCQSLFKEIRDYDVP